VLPIATPAALLRIPRPFDHPDFICEVKYDGFRAMEYLCTELAHSERCNNAVLDGKITCLGPDGRSRFTHLLFRRDWRYFMAFDVLWLDGRDMRRLR